jgi:hypothetical protein
MAVCLDLPSLTHDALAYGYCESSRWHRALVSNGRFKVNALSKAREGAGNGSLCSTSFFQIKDS